MSATGRRVFVILTRYWVHHLGPMYLRRDWRVYTAADCAEPKSGHVAIFDSREDAEAEAVVLAFERPGYIGKVWVEEVPVGSVCLT